MKKVLIITYYWPPAGGPGVQRWLKFTKYLPEFKIKPIIYCPKNPNYPIVDKSLMNEIPDGIEVLKYPIFEPTSSLEWFFGKGLKRYSGGLIPKNKKQNILEKFLIFIRGNFFVPDSRVFWVKPSVRFLSDYILKNKIDTLITTGPPHSVHMIGLQLKKRFSLRWFADFRDPWTSIGYHKDLKLSKFARKRHFLLESKVLNNSDHIIVTSSRTKQLFSDLSTVKTTVITNGYDNLIKTNKKLDIDFTITHVGLLTEKRNPKILWDVLSDLVNEIDDFKENLKLVLVGNVSQEVIKSIASAGLASFLINVKQVAHADAIDYQLKSQLLLLIEANNTNASYIIPGKLFEYINANRPILALGPMSSEIKLILEDTNAGKFFRYTQGEELKNYLVESYDCFKKKCLTVDGNDIEKYSRFNCTKKLAKLIKS